MSCKLTICVASRRTQQVEGIYPSNQFFDDDDALHAARVLADDHPWLTVTVYHERSSTIEAVYNEPKEQHGKRAL